MVQGGFAGFEYRVGGSKVEHNSADDKFSHQVDLHRFDEGEERAAVELGARVQSRAPARWESS